MDIVLADLTIDGRTVKAILHAPKNGFFYVIDRETGKLISAESFTEVTWATGIDLATGRPIEVPGARFEDRPASVAHRTERRPQLARHVVQPDDRASVHAGAPPVGHLQRRGH